jgi:hypothetical protein
MLACGVRTGFHPLASTYLQSLGAMDGIKMEFRVQAPTGKGVTVQLYQRTLAPRFVGGNRFDKN